MNSVFPNPALVSQRAVQRLPRPALFLFCTAYVLPGLFKRQPWKGSDITSFGYMVNMAEGRTSWWAPTVGGLPSDAALLPYWLGAWAIKLGSPWVDAAFAARLPFALLLVLVLALTWYTTYHLARSDAAQPLPFAFGGEAEPMAYAQAVADGGLLALIATLGLLQLGHETTPELGQLASVALLLYGLAAGPQRTYRSKLACVLALPALAASGAPSIALAIGIGATLISLRSRPPQRRRSAVWPVIGTLLAALVASALGAWAWRVEPIGVMHRLPEAVRLLAWFTWPAWPLAAWTLWRWRRHLLEQHIAVPLATVAVSVGACLAMGGSDRALMLGLPGLAVLSAFALPTLQRAAAAAIDWFSVFFFSGVAVFIWVFYIAVQTGIPPKPAANVMRLLPGFVAEFSLPPLLIAAAGTIAWVWLVRWRAGRNRHALWKSLVLPASGVALCWLMLMSLWLPALDYAKSYGPLMQRVAEHVPAGACISAPRVIRSELVALDVIAHYTVDAVTPSGDSTCPYMLQPLRPDQPTADPAGWQLIARVQRPVDRDDVTAIYHRQRRGRHGER